MIPVTHFCYLAAGLFMLGLAGLLLRREALPRLLCAQLVVAAVGLWLSAASRWWGNHDGQVAAILVYVLGTAQLAVGVAVWARHGEAAED
jgi:NADH-quinone oxidoreductase subunit K